MTALVYAGLPIGERDDLLSLTDMWRAAGAVDARSPALWVRQDGTQEFISHISSLLNIAQGYLLETERGRSGGTWAHWQIAMAYAKYLSPEFHAWCNEVVRAHMEGRSLTVREATQIAVMPIEAARELARSIVEPIVERMDANFERTWGTQKEIEKKVMSMDERLLALEKSQAQSKGRRKIKPTVKAELINDLFLLGGRCPSCSVAKIICDDGTLSKFAEFDHFYQNSAADADHVWPACKPCHADLTYGRVPRFQRETPFKNFQEQRARLPNKQAKLWLA